MMPAGLETHPGLVDGGLYLEDFRQVGVRGVTDPRNAYSHAMAWFNNRLFVGTSRDTLCLMKRPNRTLPLPKMDFWPVKCNDPEVPELMRAQIISYDPEKNIWGLVYKSPMIELKGKEVMRDVGYRGMTVHTAGNSSKPYLYAGSISATGCRMLRSEDGVYFETVGPPLDGPSVRTLFSYRGRLYTSIIGKTGSHGNESYRTEVWESDDPATGDWRMVSEPGFSDPGNASVFEMAEFNGCLYVATMNPTSGFQLWKTDAEGPAPYRWKKVLTAGAYRGFLNEFGLSMCVFNGSLYLGTGIAGGGYDRVNKVGPAAAELIRVYPDDTWDLVVGAPRLTPDGVKIPISGLSPGFDNFMNGYVWRMCAHEGHLYVGTFNAAVFGKYRPHRLKEVDREKMEYFEKLLTTGTIDEFAQRYGGCHLWRTGDGERFSPVTRDGFGTPYNMGIRQMCSTPYGLFAGTANPFGPQVGVKRNGEWAYEENARGGIEIWLGSSGVKRREKVLGRRLRDAQYRHAVLKIGRKIEQTYQSTLTDDYYENSGFNLVGYWKDGTLTAPEACRNIIDLMASKIPDKNGPALDAGCGRGAAADYLKKHFKAEDITGIDEFQWNIDSAVNGYPDMRFIMMDPARLQFEDGKFASIFCAEGAAYFDTRYKFLKEAYRALRADGRLVMADMLFSKQAFIVSRGRFRANYVRDIEAYRGLFLRAGFADVEITDLTKDCLQPYIDNISGYMRRGYGLGEISEGRFNAVMAFVSRIVFFARQYVVAAARK